MDPLTERSPTAFLDLPESLVLRILVQLDFPSLVNCERTCHALRVLSSESTRLRYVKASLRVSQTPRDPNAPADRLFQSLQRRERAWKHANLSPARASVHPAPFPGSGRGSCVSGNTLFLLSCRRAPSPASDTLYKVAISRMDLGRGECEESWVEEGVEGVLWLYVAADETEDRVVLVTASASSLGMLDETLSLFFYSFHGQRIYTERIPMSINSLNGLHLKGSSVCILYRPESHSSDDDAIVVRYASDPSAELPVFKVQGGGFLLTEDLLMQVDVKLEQLRFIHLSEHPRTSSSQRSIRTFQLPRLAPGRSYGQMPPWATPSHLTKTAQLHAPAVPVPFEIVHEGAMFEIYSIKRWVLLLDRPALLRALHPHVCATPGTWRDDLPPVPWAEWSQTVRTTILGPSTTATNSTPAVGNRLLSTQKRPKSVLLTFQEIMPPLRPIRPLAFKGKSADYTYPFVHAQTEDIPVRSKGVTLPKEYIGSGQVYFGPNHVVYVAHDEISVWRVS